jgi:hypothetical protein
MAHMPNLSANASHAIHPYQKKKRVLGYRLNKRQIARWYQ